MLTTEIVGVLRVRAVQKNPNEQHLRYKQLKYLLQEIDRMNSIGPCYNAVYEQNTLEYHCHLQYLAA